MVLEHNSHEAFYRSPFGAAKCGEEVVLRLAAVNSGLPHSVKVITLREGENESYHSMAYVMSVAGASIYEVRLKMPETEGLMWYYFELKNDEGAFCYGNNPECLGGIGRMYDAVPEAKYQITVYARDYKTPRWFSETIAYQIFPDRFYNANADGAFLGSRSDIIKRAPGDMPYYKAEQFGGEYLANDFFGGTLDGITEKLPYLAELKVGAIYLNPIFEAFSNHRYDTGDYERIDETLGDEAAFERLCTKAREYGIRIILDGVFNHTGSNSKYFNKNGKYDSVGAYNSERSPYFDWYTFSEYPEKYEAWWGMLTLPGVNEKSESYRAYILKDENSIVKRWIKKGASGWRLDVADELPGFFLKELREAVKSENEEAVIIGEVWEDASNKISYGERREYFLGKELDSVMNYPLKNMLISAAVGEIDAKTLDARLTSLRENYPRPAFFSLLNMLSSHDSERIITRLGEAPQNTDRDFQASFSLDEVMYERAIKRLNTVVGCLMTLPGTPCIYYGDEIGMEGYSDPFSRQTFKWERVNEENVALKIYKRFINIRKSSRAFSLGELKTVYKFGAVYGYLRAWEDEEYIVLINFGDAFENIRLDIACLNSKYLSDAESDEKIFMHESIYYTGIPAHEVKVFKIEK